MPTRPHHPRDFAVAIVRTLRGAGHVAYFAGGCVRDELLGRTPSDYDVATDATPDRIAQLFPRTSHVGAAFGVMLVKPKGHIAPDDIVEVATFRSDGEYTDSRRPDSVKFSTPQADAQRRDFTVNALFLDPLEADPLQAGLPESRDRSTNPHHATPPTSNPTAPGSPLAPVLGKVIDLVGGLADLRSRTLRAVGDPHQRLREDHLRALRAVRLCAKLGFTLEDNTADAIRAHATDLKGVSRERIGEELRSMFAHPSRAHAASHLAALLLTRPVLDRALDACTTPPTPRVLAGLAGDVTFPVALGAWALDLGLPIEPDPIARFVAGARPALCLSNDERATLGHTLNTLHSLCHEWAGMREAAQRRVAASVGYTGAIQLLSVYNAAAAEQVSARVHSYNQSQQGLAPEPLLTGDHLVALGWKSGPLFKQVLHDVYDAQLEGRITTREQAAALARELAHKPGV